MWLARSPHFASFRDISLWLCALSQRSRYTSHFVRQSDIAMTASLKLYLAGPDVFFRDPVERGRHLRARCAAHGFDGHFPLDADNPKPLPPTPASAMAIYRANIALLRTCNAVMANLQDFRGHEPDSGTVFEVGYAVALGLPVWGYGAPRTPITGQVPHDAAGRDARDWQVEDFALPRNLMLASAIRVIDGDVDDCLIDMRAVLMDCTVPFTPGWIRARHDATGGE